MSEIKGIRKSKGEYILRKNRGEKNENKITWEDIKSFATMQLASGINKAIGALDGIEKLNDARSLEEENER